MAVQRKRTDCDPSAAVSPLREKAARLSAKGKFVEAHACLREVIRDLRGNEPSLRLERAAVWNELGVVCKYLGKFGTAERYYRQAFRHVVSVPRKNRKQLTADLYHNLGGLEHSRGNFARAEKYARKGLRLRLEFSPACSLQAASDMAALAPILDGLGKFDESRELNRNALRSFRKHCGAFHPEIAVVLNNLAAQLQARGRLNDAEYHYRLALQMKRRVLGKSHPDVVVTMNNLGMVLHAQGKLSGARRWLEKAAHQARESLGRLHPITRDIERNYAQISNA